MKTYNGMNYKYLLNYKNIYFKDADYPIWDTFNEEVSIRWFIDNEEYMEGHWWEEHDDGHYSCGFKELTYTSVNQREANKNRANGSVWSRNTYTTVDDQYFDTDYATKMLNQEPINQREEALTRKRKGFYWSNFEYCFDEFSPILVKISDLEKIKSLRSEAYALEHKLMDLFNKSLPDNFLCHDTLQKPMTECEVKAMRKLIGDSE